MMIIDELNNGANSVYVSVNKCVRVGGVLLKAPVYAYTNMWTTKDLLNVSQHPLPII